VETSIDSKLISEFLNGDVESFNRIARRWQNRLYRFAYSYLIDEEEAKDVVQTALIKAFKNLKKLKNPDRFSSWIFQITVNLCKDTLKSSHKMRITLEKEYASNPKNNRDNFRMEDVEAEENVSAVVHKSELGEIVKKTLAKLPEEQRVVIIMKEYDGFKFSEIAEILNCPLNTVKARMYYGLQHMSTILRKLNIDKEVLFNEM